MRAMQRERERERQRQRQRQRQRGERKRKKIKKAEVVWKDNDGLLLKLIFVVVFLFRFLETTN